MQIKEVRNTQSREVVAYRLVASTGRVLVESINKRDIERAAAQRSKEGK